MEIELDLTFSKGVVVHLNEPSPQGQAAVLRNVVNLINELGEETVVELVVHGPGLDVVIRSPSSVGESNEEPDISSLLERGVTVVACANTMSSRAIGQDDLINGVGIVPSGIAQLVRRQRQGWAYLKP